MLAGFSGTQLTTPGPLTSHQLRLNRRKPQPIHNLRRKKRQRPDRHGIQQVRQVMRQHPWTRNGLQDLLFRGMLVCVTSALDPDARLDELLVVFGEELGPRGIVGEEEERQESADDGDETFYDELRVDVVSRFPAKKELGLGRRFVFRLTSQRKPSRPAVPFMWPTLDSQVQRSVWEDIAESRVCYP
jgi:hypothetical protein